MESRGLGIICYLIFVVVQIPVEFVVTPYYIGQLSLDSWYVKNSILAMIAYQGYGVTWLYSIFEDICGKHNKAIKLSIIYQVAQVIAVQTQLIFRLNADEQMKMLAAINLMLIVCIVFKHKNYFKNIQLKHIQNIKSGIPAQCSKLFTVMVYLVCSTKVASTGDDNLVIFQAIMIFFDPIWDTQYAVVEHYNMLAENNNRKQALKIAVKRGLLLNLVLLAIPIIAQVLIGLDLTNTEILEIIGIEAIAYIQHFGYSILRAYVISEFKIIQCSILVIAQSVVRFISTVVIRNTYQSEIGIIVNCVIFIPLLLFMYYKAEHRRLRESQQVIMQGDV